MYCPQKRSEHAIVAESISKHWACLGYGKDVLKLDRLDFYDFPVCYVTSNVGDVGLPPITTLKRRVHLLVIGR